MKIIELSRSSISKAGMPAEALAKAGGGGGSRIGGSCLKTQ